MCCLGFLYFGLLSILLRPSLVCLTLMDRYQILYSIFCDIYMVKYLIMLMDCYHPVNPGVNRDVKL